MCGSCVLHISACGEGLKMSEKLLPCPWCGSEAGIHPRSYSDGYSECGCLNNDCPVQPICSVKADSHPWDETKQSYWLDYDKSDVEAIAIWNTRATDSLPVYYILRRTVGGMPGRYEYFHAIGEWWLNPVGIRLFDTIDAAARTRTLEMSPDAEIIPIKLLEVPNTNPLRQVASNPTIEGF
jgi:hypothetical protein